MPICVSISQRARETRPLEVTIASGTASLNRRAKRCAELLLARAAGGGVGTAATPAMKQAHRLRAKSMPGACRTITRFASGAVRRMSAAIRRERSKTSANVSDRSSPPPSPGTVMATASGRSRACRSIASTMVVGFKPSAPRFPGAYPARAPARTFSMRSKRSPARETESSRRSSSSSSNTSLVSRPAA